jgi:hypothetical protein
MIRFKTIVVVLALFALLDPTHAAINSVVTPGPWQLYSGAGKGKPLTPTFDTQQLCQDEAAKRSTVTINAVKPPKKPVPINYLCRQDIVIVTTMVPDPPPVPEWLPLVNEGDAIYLKEPQLVRYGIDTRWIQFTVRKSATCSNEFFGTDPAPGVVKVCQLKSGPAAVLVDPDPSPAPTVPQDPPTMPDMPAHGGLPVNGPLMSPLVVAEGERIQPIPYNGGPYVPAATDVGAARFSMKSVSMAYDDPIVYPGQPGKSHLHVFFGNTNITAFTTAGNIVGCTASSAPGGTANCTGYWVPAMLDSKGFPITPTDNQAYYKTGYLGVQNADVQPFPAGLRVIAGDPMATAETPWGPARFTCDGGEIGWPSTIPDCGTGPGHQLVMTVGFPQCWDGVNLDSPDHKSHMAYASNGCPASHPVALPAITYNIHYALAEGQTTAGWRLSCDKYDGPAGYCSHGDWFNGWKQEVMQTWVTQCLNKSLDCHDFLLGDGRTLY